MASTTSLGTLSVRILANTSTFEQGFGSAIKRLSLAAGASLTVALGAAIGKGIANSAQLNASLARIGTLTDEAFSAKQVRDFSNALGIDAVQAADAVYTALSSGASSVAQAEEDVAQAGKLARSTNSDLASSLKAVVAGVNAYGSAGVDATKASDILFAAQKDGVGTMDDFATAMGTVIPAAAILGISLSEISGDLAASTLNGKSAAGAATGLKVVMQQLGDQGSKVAQIFKKQTGKSVQDFIKDGGTLNDVISTLVKTVGTNNLDSVFTAKGAGAAVKTLLVNWQAVKGAVKDTAASGGDVETAFGKVNQSLSGQLQDLKVKLQNAFGSLGDTILPGLVKDASNLFDQLSAAAKNLQPDMKTLGADISAVGSAIAPFLPSLSTVLSVAERLTPIVVALGTAFLAYKTYALASAGATVLVEGAFAVAAVATGGLTGAMILLDAAMDANPVGLVIAAIAALAAGFIYAWQTSETFRDTVTKVWNDVLTAVGLGVKAMVDLFFYWAEAPLKAFQIVLEGLGHLPSWLGGGAADGAAAAVGSLLGTIETWRKGAIGAINDVVQAAQLIPNQFGGPDALGPDEGYGDDFAAQVTAELNKQGFGKVPKVPTPDIFPNIGVDPPDDAAATKIKTALASIKTDLAGLANASTMSKDQLDSLFKTLEKDTTDAGKKGVIPLEKQWNKSLDAMAAKLTTLKDKITAELQFGTQVKQAIRDLGSVAQATEGIGTTFTGIANQQRAAIYQSNAFYAAFKKLESLGLNDVSLSQLAQAGPSALASAQALLSGGATGVAQINANQKQIDAAADKIANKSADNYYAAGQSVSKGFLAGIQSQEKALEKTMDNLGQTAAKALRKALGIHSPSLVMKGIGGYAATGLADGITAGSKKVSNASANMAGSVIFGAGSVVVGAGTRSPLETGTLTGKGIVSVLERNKAQRALGGVG